MPEQYGSDDPTLMKYTFAVNDLFQQFQQTPPSDWGQLLQELDRIREGIEQRIDAWMTLDEQIDEMLENAVLEDIDNTYLDNVDINMIEASAYPSSAALDVITMPSQPRKAPLAKPSVLTSSTETENHVMGSLRKAIGFYDLWLFKEASSLFAQILKSQPDNILALLFYAAAETTQGRFENVLPELEKVHKSNEAKFRAAANEIAAAGYFKQGNLNKAVDSLLHVVSLQPDNEDAWFNLGYSYIKLEDWNAAAGALSQVLDMNNYDDAAQELLIEVWNRLGEYDAALKLSEKGLAQRPGHSGFLQSRARSLRLTGKLRESLRIYQQVILQNPRQQSAYNEYATVCLEAGDLETAAAVLQKSLSLVPDRTEHKEKLAVLLLLQQRAEEAYKLLQSVQHSSEASFIHTIALAQYEWQKGGKEKALTLLEGVLQQSDSEFRQLAAHYYKQLLNESKRKHETAETIHNLKNT